jgi:hypothetical protein
MYLFYFDESGDSGHPGLVSSPTNFFVLSCVLIHQDHWLKTLDSIVRFRSSLRREYGLRVRGEIKATDFWRGHGAFEGKGIDRRSRMELYRRVLEFQREELTELRTFTVAIAKRQIGKTDTDIRERAWQFALQRVDRYLDFASERRADLGIIFPDEGHGDMIRTLLRRVRRHQSIRGHFGGRLEIPTDKIVEDPSDRASQNSYFIQLADWNALACHRSKYVDPNRKIPADLWDELGQSRLLEVNNLTGGPPGIVVWPRTTS